MLLLSFETLLIALERLELDLSEAAFAANGVALRRLLLDCPSCAWDKRRHMLRIVTLHVDNVPIQNHGSTPSIRTAPLRWRGIVGRMWRRRRRGCVCRQTCGKIRNSWERRPKRRQKRWVSYPHQELWTVPDLHSFSYLDSSLLGWGDIENVSDFAPFQPFSVLGITLATNVDCIATPHNRVCSIY